jgi:hypothetical protein
LHTRPGKVLSKLVSGSATIRQLDILQFVEASELASTKPSFFYEDAFAGEEDCVCRGGRCPRREGCVFWVNKQLRDSASSLIVEERGFSTFPLDRSILFDTETGPREFINGGKADKQPGTAVLFEAFLKDAEVAERGAGAGGLIPDIQYYLADRLDCAGTMGAKLKVTAVKDPLGVMPMHVPWRGEAIGEV